MVGFVVELNPPCLFFVFLIGGYFFAQTPKSEWCLKLGWAEIQVEGSISYMEHQASANRNLKQISNFKGVLEIPIGSRPLKEPSAQQSRLPLGLRAINIAMRPR